MSIQQQGSQTRIVMQQEVVFKTTPASGSGNRRGVLLYYTQESLRQSRELLTSNIIRGSRQPAAPVRGNVETGGTINTEFQAYIGNLFHAVCGKVTTTHTSGTEGADITVTAATQTEQYLSCTKTTHGLAIGDNVVLAGWTPAALNGVWGVVSITSADVFVLRVAELPAAVTVIGTTKKITGAPIYTHVFKVGGQLPSYTIEKQFLDLGQYFRYNGCKANKMTLNVTPSGFQDMTVDFMGAEEAVFTSPYTSGGYDADLGKVVFDGFSIATVEEGGVACGFATGIDGLTIDNDIDGTSYVIGGAGVRRYLPAGVVKVTGTLKTLFEAMDSYNKALNNTETSLKVVYQVGTGVGTAGNEKVTLFIPELLLKPQAPVITGPKGVLVELPFEAYYDNYTTDSHNSAMSITLICTAGPSNF